MFYNIDLAEQTNDPKLFKKLQKDIWEFRTLFEGKQIRLLAFWDKDSKTETLVFATSLLPELKGLHTHERAISQRANIHGCTVHYVVSELDAGPIIAQAAVPVLDDDTPDRLAARVLEQEVRLYPKALADVAVQLAQK